LVAGREVEAATAVLGLACLPAAFAEEHVEELAIPHKHNKQLTLRFVLSAISEVT
jgi:hypothetical protein